ncbi:MAG: hypothetical protein ACYT04_14945 [Nostoc sp.]
MYFNAFLAKTLLAFSGELRVRRDAINRVCTGVRSYYFPHAQCPILLYKRLRQRLLYERLRERYSRISHKSCHRTPRNPYPEYVSGIFESLFFDAV